MIQEEAKGKWNALFKLAIAAFCMLTIGCFYFATVAYRALPLQHLKVGAVGRLYGFDPLMGPVPLPHATGFLQLPGGGRAIPTHHDGNGVRTPVGVRHEYSPLKRPRLLFIGDSFTYGDFTLAEDAFAYKTAIKLSGESVNGGVNGFGLAQMVLRARQFIPEYKPDYVVVQYSPWLVMRSMSEFGPSYYPVHAPVPYYADDIRPRIVQPAFIPPSFDDLLKEPFDSYGQLKFLRRIAIPVFAADDFNVARFRIKQLLGFRENPSENSYEIIRSAYSDIAKAAEENDAEMIILVLGETADPFYIPGDLFPPGVHGVNGRIALLRELPEPNNEWWVRNYWHWAGTPPTPVDSHPNERAHEIIADALAERIRLLEKSRQAAH
ncbi:MAG: hypothetical protein K0Q68_1453 [Moraxellaceae bacterium]|nr:hypothetical protein [Moraxellaceae bacterium]